MSLLASMNAGQTTSIASSSSSCTSTAIATVGISLPSNHHHQTHVSLTSPTVSSQQHQQLSALSSSSSTLALLPPPPLPHVNSNSIMSQLNYNSSAKPPQAVSSLAFLNNYSFKYIEKYLEEAQLTGDLQLSNKNLNQYPTKLALKYDLSDTITAGISFVILLLLLLLLLLL
jgi:hypothetical protein